MNEHRATETAYKNGYKQGTIDAVRKMQEMLHERFGDDSNRVFSNYNIHRYIDQVAEQIARENS
jgi:hypothetical protein